MNCLPLRKHEIDEKKKYDLEFVFDVDVNAPNKAVDFGFDVDIDTRMYKTNLAS